MIRKPIFFFLLISAAVGVPYVSTSSKELLSKVSSAYQKFTSSPPSQQDTSSSTPEESEKLFGESHDTGSAASVTSTYQPPLEGFPVYDLGEVLRMDVSPNWVYQRWARKTTALAEIELHGIRVPLVTGTNVDDLAGSLTYYFNHQGRVERIKFHGRTGDTRKLVALLVQRYEFRQQRSDFPDERLFQVTWNRQPMSELRITPAPVIRSETPHSSFIVDLELVRPGSGRYLSRIEEKQRLQQQQKQLQRLKKQQEQFAETEAAQKKTAEKEKLQAQQSGAAASSQPAGNKSKIRNRKHHLSSG